MRYLIIPILLALSLSGCASLTSDQIFEREYALVEAQAVYLRRSIACKNSGGHMVMTFQGVASRLRPHKHEYDSARCYA
ncbi:MAG: hypothetical protein E2O84_08040 [Bacteroidetes bacterium]|nr:MAG: hypothetical protein E2O84_08040 [Bacteroidota bacterium]